MLDHLPSSTRKRQKQNYSKLTQLTALKNPLNHVLAAQKDSAGHKRSKSELYNSLLAFFEEQAIRDADANPMGPYQEYLD